MANHLDLEEQEQLDQLKHFWKQYGNWINSALIVVLGAVASWNGYQYWQRSQSVQASAMFDEVERVTKAGDPLKVERAFADMKARFGKTVFTQQAALMVAKMAYDSGKPELAKVTLEWLAANATDEGYGSVARLRLSALLIEAKAYDDALKVLTASVTPDFAALVDDRRGDIYVLKNAPDEAKTAYQKAYTAFDAQSEYRRLVGVKLNALGVNPEPSVKKPVEAGSPK